MYKINDKIFYLKIDEQVEYLTQLINEIDEEYKDSTTALDSRITALEAKSKEFDEAFTLVNEKLSTLESTEKSHYEEVLASIAEQATTFQGKIDDLKSELEQEIALKQNINDDTLKTDSKKIVGAINENKDTIDSNKTELENKIAVKQDMTDDNLKTNTKTIVGAINEIFDKESAGVAIDEKTITLTDNNAIQVNPDILSTKTLTLHASNIIEGDIAVSPEDKSKIILNTAYMLETDPSKHSNLLTYAHFLIANEGISTSSGLYPENQVLMGFSQYGVLPDELANVLFAAHSTGQRLPENAYISATQAIQIEEHTGTGENDYMFSPFLTFSLIKDLFTPIGYVMASTQATVPVYWGTWQQIGYTTINSVNIYYYKRTA